jgi:hypothetical protein
MLRQVMFHGDLYLGFKKFLKKSKKIMKVNKKINNQIMMKKNKQFNNTLIVIKKLTFS